MIRGSLTNRAGDPLPSIEVSVTAVEHTSYGEAFRTDADGTYEIRLYAPGSYRLTVKDWSRQYMDGKVEVVAGANETVTGIDMVLERTAASRAASPRMMGNRWPTCASARCAQQIVCIVHPR